MAQERLFDTVLGCVIAFSASYFLFPDWEAQQIKKYMADVLQANAAYLQQVADYLGGKPLDRIAYKLARKHVYVQSANLTAAYQRMAAEPKNQQYDKKLMHQFVVRNHLLFSNIAHLATLLADVPPLAVSQSTTLANQAITKLYGLSKKLDATAEIPALNTNEAVVPAPTVQDAPRDETIINQNVAFIKKLSDDIGKTTDAILAA